MKYFGTDGIRLESTQELKQIAKQLAFALFKKGAKNIVLGKDSQTSGRKIAKAFSKQAQKFGINIYYLGMVPSACVAYYTVKKQANFGVVITASHNPASMNGIKIFDPNGEKLEPEVEEQLEHYIDTQTQIDTSIKKGKFWRIKPTDYIHLLCANACPLSGKKIVIDCANGAAKKIAPKVFCLLGAKVVAVHTGSGRKINHNCGAVHPQSLAKKVVQTKAHLGFAFDGDADRCVCVLDNGQVLSGDNLLLAISKHIGAKKVVGTIYSNGALDEHLAKCGITLLRSNVGDQEVKKLMKQTNCTFGGERSGHMIFSNILPTGDGILTALQICKIAKLKKASKFKKMPSVVVNLATKDKQKSMQKLEPVKTKYEQQFLNQGRILVRPSGTENLIRILVEHQKISVAKRVAKALTLTHEKE